MLTRQRLREEVERVEQSFAGDLPRIRRRSLLLASVAYAYLAGAVLLCAAVALGAIALILFVPRGWSFYILGSIAVVAIALGLSIVRAIFARLEGLPGMELERRDAPELFRVVDELSAEYPGVSVDSIRIDDEFNAAVAQIPRFGLLGFYRTTLILGLPLLQTHTPSDLRAVLAHELAHAAHRDGQAGAWISRTWRTWDHLEQVIEQGQSGRILLAPFLRWFWPKFSAYALVAMREAETLADRASLRVSSSSESATALSRIATWSGWLSERFWTEVWKRAGDQPEPPENIFDELVAQAARGISAEDRQRYFQEALRTAPESWDTHPTFEARLAALGHPVRETSPAPELPTIDISQSAAVAYLGESYPGLVKMASDAWSNSVRVEWIEAHQQIKQLRRELPEDSAVATAEEHWKRSQLALLTAADDSVDWLERTLELSPDHGEARMTLGTKLLETDPPRGLEMLESLCADQPIWAGAAMEQIRSFHSEHGHVEALEALDQRLDTEEEEHRLSMIERYDLKLKDEFLPHEAPADLVNAVCALLARERPVLAAYLAQKRIQHLSSLPAYVLCIETESRWYKLAPNRRDQEIIGRIFEDLPDDKGSFIVFINRDDYRSPGRKIIRASGEPIYLRDE